MSRFRHYTFNTFACLSGLLLLATLGLWADSHHYHSLFGVTKPKVVLGLFSENGHLKLGSTRIIVPGKNFNTRDYGRHFGRTGRSSAKGTVKLDFEMYMVGFGLNWGPTPFLPQILSSYTICFPHWFVALVLAIGPTIWVLKWRQGRKFGPNACVNCGYDLTGNETGECPECGQIITARQGV